MPKPRKDGWWLKPEIREDVLKSGLRAMLPPWDRVQQDVMAELVDPAEAMDLLKVTVSELVKMRRLLYDSAQTAERDAATMRQFLDGREKDPPKSTIFNQPHHPGLQG